IFVFWFTAINIFVVIFFKQRCGGTIFAQNKSVRTQSFYIIENNLENGENRNRQKHTRKTPNRFGNHNIKQHYKRIKHHNRNNDLIGKAIPEDSTYNNK